MKCSAEFKVEAARQVIDHGRPVREVASRLGVSIDSMYQWLREQRKAPAARQMDNALTLENRRLPSGQVLVAGGWNNFIRWNAELFDPATSSWTATTSMNTQRSNFMLMPLLSGRVLAATGGGFFSEVYDPASAAWREVEEPATNRYGAPLIRLASGRVLMIGGRHGSGSIALASVEEYEPHSGRWAEAGDRIYSSGMEPPVS